MQSILTEVPTWPVMKILLPQIIGDDEPEGRAVFHKTFLVGPNSFGTAWLRAWPLPFDPRKIGQVCSSARPSKLTIFNPIRSDSFLNIIC